MCLFQIVDIIITIAIIMFIQSKQIAHIAQTFFNIINLANGLNLIKAI